MDFKRIVKYTGELIYTKLFYPRSHLNIHNNFVVE